MRGSRILANGNALPMLLGGAILLLAALLTRLATGSPLWLFHFGDAAGVLPPLWLTGLLWLLSFFTVGAAAGYVLSCRSLTGGREAYLWRGCTFLILAVVFTLIWYTLLFGKRYLLPSWLFLPLAAGGAAVCALSWRHVSRVACVAVWCFALWQIIVFWLQLRVMWSL